MVTITVDFTADDFDKIVYMGKHWHPDDNQPNIYFGAITDGTFKRIYWVSTYLEAMFCKQYLSSIGYESSTARDRGLTGYAIFTNYESSLW
jgi:hypothetical protein